MSEQDDIDRGKRAQDLWARNNPPHHESPTIHFLETCLREANEKILVLEKRNSYLESALRCIFEHVRSVMPWLVK